MEKWWDETALQIIVNRSPNHRTHECPSDSAATECENIIIINESLLLSADDGKGENIYQSLFKSRVDRQFFLVS